MRYILLLRGINVGGKNKVVMSELKALLESLNFQNVHSYINSGNLFFSSTDTFDICISKIKNLLESHYEFSIPFVLLTKEEYLEEIEKKLRESFSDREELVKGNLNVAKETWEYLEENNKKKR